MTGKNKKPTARGRASEPGTQGQDTAFDPVALAEKNFNRVLRALDALADDLHGREDSAVAKAAKLAGEARSAIQTIFNERQRLAKLDDDTSGALRAELDLDAARAEIGRRLALLRERTGTEGLSGGAE
ncbi:MAG: hypothetical protein KDK53_06600 [Maritimibacter sp.]|nr:hypothetical protein [Maritimibacter sp.]